MRLEPAEHEPTQRAEDLPPVQILRVGTPPGDTLVSVEQVVTCTDPGHRRVTTETPGAHAQPPQILDRISDMCEFPIENGFGAAGSDQ